MVVPKMERQNCVNNMNSRDNKNASQMILTASVTFCTFIFEL